MDLLLEWSILAKPDSIKIDAVLQPTIDSLFAAKKEHREGFHEPLYGLGLLEQGLSDWLLQYGLANKFPNENSVYDHC